MNNGEMEKLTRRDFISSSVKGLGILTLANQVPRLHGQDAIATAKVPEESSPGILVIVHLKGGNDGLNTVVPINNRIYYGARPNLALPKHKTIPLNDSFGLHYSLTELAKVYENKQLAIVQNVGLLKHSKSHEQARDIWAYGGSNFVNSRTGWIGRYFDSLIREPDPVEEVEEKAAASLGRGLPERPGRRLPGLSSSRFSGKLPNPLAAPVVPEFTLPAFKVPLGIGIGRVLPKAFYAEKENKFFTLFPADAHRTHSFAYAVDEAVRNGSTTLLAEILEISKREGRITDLSRVYADDHELNDVLVRIVNHYEPVSSVTYADDAFSQSMKAAISLVNAYSDEIGVIHVEMDGFDTHAAQGPVHAKLLSNFSKAMSSFQEDLRIKGLDERVLTVVYSEFGRSLIENSSKGTDHGTTGPMFLMGAGVKGGLYGGTPTLRGRGSSFGKMRYGADIPFDVHATDFRQVFATVLQDWMKVDGAAVFGREYDVLDLFAS